MFAQGKWNVQKRPMTPRNEKKAYKALAALQSGTAWRDINGHVLRMLERRGLIHPRTKRVTAAGREFVMSRQGGRDDGQHGEGRESSS